MFWEQRLHYLYSRLDIVVEKEYRGQVCHYYKGVDEAMPNEESQEYTPDSLILIILFELCYYSKQEKEPMNPEESLFEALKQELCLRIEVNGL